MKNYQFYVNRHDLFMMSSGAFLVTAVKSNNVKARALFGILGAVIFFGDAIRVSDEELARWRENGSKVADKIYERITKKDNDNKNETPEQ